MVIYKRGKTLTIVSNRICLDYVRRLENLGYAVLMVVK